MSAKGFIRELARMMDGNPTLPDWAVLPKNEQELWLLWGVLDLEEKELTGYETPYERYLKSGGWLWRRGVVMVLSRHRCACCSSVATEVHHKSYQRVGAELLRDLLPVCRECHEGQHLSRGMFLKGMDEIRKQYRNRKRKQA